MAKKQNSGLGRGLDSLIPKIKEIEQDVEEGLSLEDLLKKSDDEEEIEETVEETVEEEAIEEQEDISTEETETEEEPDEEEDEPVVEKDETEEEKIEIEDEPKEELETEAKEEETSNYTNIFSNDDEIVTENSAKTIEISSSKNNDKNIESSVNLNKETEESIKINEDKTKENDSDSILSEKEEKLVYEVIETVEKNPRITLWSARSAAVLRYLRKTEPEFSISNEASNLIDEAIAEKYPEIWTLFNHLWLSTLTSINRW